MDKYVVSVKPVYVKSSRETLGKAVLRDFQAKLADIEEGAVLLIAPTGSGKTVTLLTDRWRGVSIGLYPNNEIVCSQIAGLHRFTTEFLEMKPESTWLLDYCLSGGETLSEKPPLNTYVSEKPVDMFGRRVVKLHVAGLTGRLVRTLGERGKLEVLVNTIAKNFGGIRRDESRYGIVLGTPDAFFLLALFIYRDLEKVGELIDLILRARSQPLDSLEYLLRRHGFTRTVMADIASVLDPLLESTVFIDEYHLYGLYELSSLKILAWVLRHIHEWDGRVVFSSATPRRRVAGEVAEAFGYDLVEIDATRDVREKGDYAELVRGSAKLVFTPVETSAKNRVSKLFKSSEEAHVLVNTPEFREFMDKYRDGKGRGVVIVEKVYHAEMFAKAVYGNYGVKPTCAYSMASEETCRVNTGYVDHGRLLVVGTGAKIGQGVEYVKTTFGVVARTTAPDFLQSISRIGRRTPEESTILIPVDETLMPRVVKNIKQETSYVELANWVEHNGEPYLRAIPERYGGVYSKALRTREELLKLLSISLYYRFTGAYTETYRSIDTGVLGKLVVLAPANTLYELAMFRSTGPQVQYCRETDRSIECTGEREDLGTITRNFEVKSWRGRLLLTRGGRGELRVYCGKGLKLSELIDEMNERILVAGWRNLAETYECYIVDSWGNRLTELEKELEKHIFILIPLKDKHFTEYIAKTGKGLPLNLEAGTAKTPLLYI